MIGASLTAVMETVVLPVALSAPPPPCAPLLPSLKNQSTCTVAGGASLPLAYAICCIASLTSTLVALLSNASSNEPDELVVTVPIVVPATTRLPPCVSGSSVPPATAENWSSTLAPLSRASNKVAPAKLSLSDNSRSRICTLPSSTTGEPPSMNVGLPSSAPERNVASKDPSGFRRATIDLENPY